MGCCGSAERTRREWRPLEDRSCTDLPWFLLFTVFCVGMGCICSYTIVTGGAARLVFGYDSYGNTCGQRNEPIEGVRLSGLDHRDRHLLGPAVNQQGWRAGGGRRRDTFQVEGGLKLENNSGVLLNALREIGGGELEAQDEEVVGEGTVCR
ncbi:unnamed protein product [Boreogadus saida]